MTRFAIRLALAGGRESLTRLAAIAVAVAVGVALLLSTVAATNAVRSQNDRYAWLLTGSVAEPSDASDAAIDSLWWMLRQDHFDGLELIRVDLAATGDQAPLPPGMDVLPGPGEYAASPALVALLSQVPAAELADRFAGELVATIGDDALPSPDSLVVVVGRTVEELESDGRAALVQQISTTSPADCRECAAVLGIAADGVLLVLTVIAATLVLPVLVFVGSATRLSAARRERRFAALRLVGATPRQVSVLAAVEASGAAMAGAVVGFGLFALLRAPLATIGFTGDRFFALDLALTFPQVVAVGIGVPLAAASTALFALRRVQISPLGVQRRATPPPPRAWRLVPLVAGIAELGWFAVVGRPATSSAQIAAYIPGVTLTLFGLVVAGPWLTMAGARLIAHRTDRASVLIAGRRLADDPRAAFRSISGVVLALCVASGAVGAIATLSGGRPLADGDGTTLVQNFTSPESERPTSVAEGAGERLAAIDGVTAVTPLRLAPGDGVGGQGRLVSCADLAHAPALGRCPDGTEVVEINTAFGGSVIEGVESMADTVWPEVDVDRAELTSMPLALLVVSNDGSRAAIEGARTVLVDTIAERFPPETVEEIDRHGTEDLVQYQRLASVVVLVGLVIAGCSLAVGVAGGLIDRQRPFRLLRLTGVPLHTLRRVLVIETVAPLLLTSAVAIAAGFLAAELFVRAQLERSLSAPGTGYVVAVTAGLGAALIVVGWTLPLLDRVTRLRSVHDDPTDT